MQNLLVKEIRAIVQQLSHLPVANEFIRRIQQGKLTRDENPQSHFCVYFAAYDLANKRVFIGHHKKSDLWLFNGGHIDPGETTSTAMLREMNEEWGLQFNLEKIAPAKLLSITSVINPSIKCQKHYDIWYFVPVSMKNFLPDQEKLASEFYTTAWKTIAEAKRLVSDQNTLLAIKNIEKLKN